jgi:hypothetical protein
MIGFANTILAPIDCIYLWMFWQERGSAIYVWENKERNKKKWSEPFLPIKVNIYISTGILYIHPSLWMDIREQRLVSSKATTIIFLGKMMNQWIFSK